MARKLSKISFIKILFCTSDRAVFYEKTPTCNSQPTTGKSANKKNPTPQLEIPTCGSLLYIIARAVDQLMDRRGTWLNLEP